MHVDGSCHCGAIRFEADVDPARTVICHCSDCQIMSGSAFRTVVQAPADKFTLLRGKPKIYEKTGDSGNRRALAFCPICSSQLYATSAEPPRHLYGIRVGTLSQRDQLPPQAEVWCSSRLGWLTPLAVPQVERQ